MTATSARRLTVGDLALTYAHGRTSRLLDDQRVGALAVDQPRLADSI